MGSRHNYSKQKYEFSAEHRALEKLRKLTEIAQSCRQLLVLQRQHMEPDRRHAHRALGRKSNAQFMRGLLSAWRICLNHSATKVQVWVNYNSCSLCMKLNRRYKIITGNGLHTPTARGLTKAILCLHRMPSGGNKLTNLEIISGRNILCNGHTKALIKGSKHLA